jgi:Ca2+:H+ antiporter
VAVESSFAVVLGVKNPLDLSLAIAIGTSIPIALFAAPVLVLASYFIAPQPGV